MVHRTRDATWNSSTRDMPWSQWIPSKHTQTHALQVPHPPTPALPMLCVFDRKAPKPQMPHWHSQAAKRNISRPILRPSSVLSKHLQDTLCIKFHGCSLHSSLNILFFSPLHVYSWDHTSAFTWQMDLADIQKVPSFPDKQKIISIICYHFHSLFWGIWSSTL